MWKSLPDILVLKPWEEAHPKKSISTSSELDPLQMVWESAIGQCASEDAGSQGIDRKISRLEGGMKHFLWKPLLNKWVLKLWS